MGDLLNAENSNLTEIPITEEILILATSPTSTSSNSAVIHYKYVVPLMIILCTVSTIINLKILATVFWIRRPLSPTLQISLSLAGADAYSSSTLGIGFFVNSWLPTMKYVKPTSVCPMLIFEGLRLGGVIMTVLHLLYLASNHYLGIVKPLQYASIMTRRHTNAILILIWISPIALCFVYFSTIENDGFRVEKCDFQFMKKWNFRLIFSLLFLGPFVLMVIIYTHIFIIVKRHQDTRLKFKRTGSMGTQRRTLNDNNKSKYKGPEHQMERNVKALWTTLMILGSYVIGWMPGTIYFLLVCDDCYLKLNYFHQITTFYICSLTNLFIIMKTIMNPIIYAARMTEIKIATSKMNAAIKNKFKGNQTTLTVEPLAMTATFAKPQGRADKANSTSEEWNSQSHLMVNIHPMPNRKGAITSI